MMTSECGPWRSCDFHQYRSWLRRAQSATSSVPPPEKDKQKAKKLRRRPLPGEFHLTFRHHDDPADYERDYLNQVTHARCRLANPAAALLPEDLPERRHVTPSPAPEPSTDLALQESSDLDDPLDGALDDPSAITAEPATDPQTLPRTGIGGAVTPLPQVTASTPDLSASSSSPTPWPASSPDLCQLPRIKGATAPRQPPPQAAEAPAPAPAARSGRAVAGSPPGAARSRLAHSTPRLHRPREESSRPAAEARAPPRPRRPPPHQIDSQRRVSLELPAALAAGRGTQARRNCNKPRGLTRIQFASSVPENLTIIVGRKLEINLSGAKRGLRGRGGR